VKEVRGGWNNEGSVHYSATRRRGGVVTRVSRYLVSASNISVPCAAEPERMQGCGARGRKPDREMDRVRDGEGER